MADAVPSGMRATASMNINISSPVTAPRATVPSSTRRLIDRNFGRINPTRITAAKTSRSQVEPAGVSAANKCVLSAAPS